MLTIMTKEQINENALECAKRARRIAVTVDAIHEETELLSIAIKAYMENLWQPIEFAPKTPFPDSRSQNLLLRTREYPWGAEGRWMAKDGSLITRNDWYVLGFTGPIAVEPTHFRYLSD
jgi:hypothetical protein